MNYTNEEKRLIQEKGSMVFYLSWLDAITNPGSGISEHEQYEFITALIRYGCTGEEPTLAGVPKILFDMVRHVIDVNTARYVGGCKGGRRQKAKPKVKPMVKPSDNHRLGDNEYDNENENEHGCPSELMEEMKNVLKRS